MSEDKTESFFKSEYFVHLLIFIAAVILGGMLGYLWGHKEGFDFGVELTKLIYKSCGK